MLVCRKIFSAFYPTLHESFSNSYGFALLQEFNPFYHPLGLYDRKYFCSILTDLSNLLFLFHQKFFKLAYEKCCYETVSKNAEADVRKCFSETVAQRCSVKQVFLEISQNSQENTCARVSLLIKLQAKNFILKRDPGRDVSCEFYKIWKNTFFLQYTSAGCF